MITSKTYLTLLFLTIPFNIMCSGGGEDEAERRAQERLTQKGQRIINAIENSDAQTFEQEFGEFVNPQNINFQDLNALSQARTNYWKKQSPVRNADMIRAGLWQGASASLAVEAIFHGNEQLLPLRFGTFYAAGVPWHLSLVYLCASYFALEHSTLRYPTIACLSLLALNEARQAAPNIWNGFFYKEYNISAQQHIQDILAKRETQAQQN